MKEVGGSRRIFADRRTPDGSLRSFRITVLDPELDPWDFDLLWSLNRCSPPRGRRSPGSADHALDVIDAWLCRLVPWEEIPPGQPLRVG